MYGRQAAQDLQPFVRQAQLLAMQFDSVVANPPYMGSKGMPPALKEFSASHYPAGKSDLFSAFIERSLELCRTTGLVNIVAMQSWMFLSSFESLRRKLLSTTTIGSLVHIGYNSFPEINSKIVQVCAFSAHAARVPEFLARYVNLNSAEQSANKDDVFLGRTAELTTSVHQEIFSKLPGSPLVYWLSEHFLQMFDTNSTVSDFSVSDGQNKTGDNERYLRCHWEVDVRSIAEKSWIPYAKGGPWRKWYGNVYLVICWTSSARQHYKKDKIARLIPEYLWYRDGVTWSFITTKDIGFRYLEPGGTFDVGGSSLFFESEDLVYSMLAMLNSKPATTILKFLNPTISLQVENVRSVPVPVFDMNRAATLARSAVQLSKIDWDIDEASRGFKEIFFLECKNGAGSLGETWVRWSIKADERVLALKELEERINELLIDAYGLQSELSPEVPEDQITLSRADREKDCQRLISYAIGCMMGRYSLDEPGLIYAHAGNVGFDPSRYVRFPADADGILPVTDEHWFEDDAPARVREFLQTVWGPDTLAENLAWLAESLGTKGSETPEETIRRYIADKFYKDHLQTYKKRPIYWLFSSGKQGAFQALVYLHRYHEGTLARMRAEYVIPLSAKMAARLEMLEQDANAATSAAARTKVRKQIESLRKKQTELLAFDEKLRHYADMRITLDLDDGVKVNYGKFGDLLEGVKLVTGGAGDE